MDITTTPGADLNIGDRILVGSFGTYEIVTIGGPAIRYESFGKPRTGRECEVREVGRPIPRRPQLSMLVDDQDYEVVS